jgi:hypothetical protein
MTMRPDPTFHASPRLAMEAPPENFAYTVLLSPDFSRPDALAVIDVRPDSPTFSQIVHTVTMPYKGDEFHHFGWNNPFSCCFNDLRLSSAATRKCSSAARRVPAQPGAYPTCNRTEHRDDVAARPEPPASNQ